MRIYCKREFVRRPGKPLGSILVKYVKTSEFRPPKRGEQYLSGAIPEVYRAPNDLTTVFHILVKYEKSMTEQYVLALKTDLMQAINLRIQACGFDKSMVLEALTGLTKEIEKL